MKDPAFIKEMLLKIREATTRVKIEFSNLSERQLNWKPAEDKWSIAQCLDHLVASDGVYFPAFSKIAAGEFKMNTWERWSPFGKLFGRLMVKQMQEEVRMKLKAPKMIRPSLSNIDAGIIQRFYDHEEEFMSYVARIENLDIDKTFFTSPLAGIITYNLRDAVTLLTTHKHRHISQAMRVKMSEGFPK